MEYLWQLKLIVFLDNTTNQPTKLRTKNWIEINNHPSNLAAQNFIEDFSLFIIQPYCIVWSVEKIQKAKNPKVARTNNGNIMLLSKWEVCDSKKSNFIKQQEATVLLSSLGIKTPLSKIPLVGPFLL